ncbi:glycerophosphodiester phosphodiesterase family protein [Pacificimonas pallii]|nr:glycerophosphodiester phosphodiesterase family protein [Pacificimonas pallii]
MAILSAKPFAHRGLHAENGPVENSVAAFEAAINAGFGIELDVQLTQEAGAVVFHDSTLERLSEGTGPVLHKSMKALEAIKLRNSDEKIRTLQDVLLHIGGRTPVLIEAKVGQASPLALALAVRRALEGYVGPVGIMSFHPAVSRWFHDHFPLMLNGLVVSEEPDTAGSAWRASAPARFFAIQRARPKFIAYDVRSLPSRLARHFQKPGKRTFTWTVRTDQDIAVGRAHADQLILEGHAAAQLAGRKD